MDIEVYTDRYQREPRTKVEQSAARTQLPAEKLQLILVLLEPRSISILRRS